MGVKKRNGEWHIDFRANGRRVREKVGPSKGEAENALAIRKAEVIHGRYKFQSRQSVPSFQEFSKRYLRYAEVTKPGIRNERYRISILVRTFRHRKLSDLKAWDAEKYKAERSQKVKPATINRELGNLKHMMTMAVTWGYINENPFSCVKLLHVPKKVERVLTTDEECLLLAACDRIRSPFLRPIVIIALNTGMRRGEILSLQWNQVDLLNRTIRIYNGKTRSSERVIPMNNTVFTVCTQLAKQRSDDLVFPSPRKGKDKILDPKKAYAKAVRLAGIAHVRFHDLRHAFATRLVRAGVDLITLQKLLGHASIAMTARYSHALADAKIAAVAKLDGSEMDPRWTPDGFCHTQESTVN